MSDNNKWMLRAVKLVVTAFNIPDTYYAFDAVFSKTGRPENLKLFTIFMAILAVDVVFLWVLGVLEDFLHPLKKLPYALGAMLFAVFSVWIGFKSEGDIIAFVPRIGLLMVVFIYLTAFIVDMYDYYFSREQVEQRMNNSKAKKLRRIERTAYEKVLDESVPLFKENHRKRLHDKLGIPDIPVAEHSAPLTQQTMFVEPEELPEFIFETERGYGWESPYTGEYFVKTSTGSPYTLPGAKIALSRHEKEHGRNNGHAF